MISCRAYVSGTAGYNLFVSYTRFTGDSYGSLDESILKPSTLSIKCMKKGMIFIKGRISLSTNITSPYIFALDIERYVDNDNWSVIDIEKYGVSTGGVTLDIIAVWNFNANQHVRFGAHVDSLTSGSISNAVQNFVYYVIYLGSI